MRSINKGCEIMEKNGFIWLSKDELEGKLTKNKLNEWVEMYGKLRKATDTDLLLYRSKRKNIGENFVFESHSTANRLPLIIITAFDEIYGISPLED